MDASELVGSTVRVVRILFLILLLPLVYTVRRMDVQLQPELVANVVVWSLLLVSVFVGSAVVFIYSLEAIHRFTQN